MLKTWSDKGVLCRQSCLAQNFCLLLCFDCRLADNKLVDGKHCKHGRHKKNAWEKFKGRGLEVFDTSGASEPLDEHSHRSSNLPLHWLGSTLEPGLVILSVSLSPHHPSQSLSPCFSPHKYFEQGNKPNTQFLIWFQLLRNCWKNSTHRFLKEKHTDKVSNKVTGKMYRGEKKQ